MLRIHTRGLNFVARSAVFLQMVALILVTAPVTALAAAENNSTLSGSCGLDIALVLDSSASINENDLGTMKTDFKNLISTFLPATPTSFSVTSFYGIATIHSQFTSDVGNLTDAIEAIDDFTPRTFTNWQDGLVQARSTFGGGTSDIAKANLIIFASDGNPNRLNNSTSTDAVETLDAAIAEADAIKAEGTRIITVGIGSGVNQANLEAISSADANYSAANFSELSSALDQIVTDLCPPTADLSIEKTVNNESPEVGDTIIYTLTATNNGPADASNIVVHDEFPAGLTFISSEGGEYAASTHDWTITSLPNASSTVLRITASVNSGTEGQKIVNSASINFDEESEVTDPNTEDNNASSSELTVNTPPSNGGGGGNSSGSRPQTQGQVLGTATTTVAIPQVLGASCGLYMDQHLKKGSSENNPEQVTKLQQFLVKHGYGTFTPTGYFGSLTEAAVKAFQSKYAEQILKPWNLSAPTGLVYLTTIRQINLIECPELVIPMPSLVPWISNPKPQ